MDPELALKVGLASHLPPLLERAGVARVGLEVLTKRPSYRGSERSDLVGGITARAREEHKRRGFGFWEFALGEAIDTDPRTRAELIEGALRHHGTAESHIAMTLAEFDTALREDRFALLAPRMLVSLTSRVFIEGNPVEGWHLPMIDFGVPVSPQGQAACLDALYGMDAKGLLFASGKSYHFYAGQLLTEREFWKFLARAQLLSPIVDARWVSHQILDGRASLRISTDEERHPDPHRLVEVVD